MKDKPIKTKCEIEIYQDFKMIAVCKANTEIQAYRIADNLNHDFLSNHENKVAIVFHIANCKECNK